MNTEGRFRKGQAKTPGSGRKAGTPNKVRFEDIAEVCAAKNYDPLKELIDLLPSLPPEAQARVHTAILPFTRPKKFEVDPTGGNLGLSNPLRSKTAEELIQLLPVTNAQGAKQRA